MPFSRIWKPAWWCRVYNLKANASEITVVSRCYAFCFWVFEYWWIKVEFLVKIDKFFLELPITVQKIESISVQLSDISGLITGKKFPTILCPISTIYRPFFIIIMKKQIFWAKLGFSWYRFLETCNRYGNDRQIVWKLKTQARAHLWPFFEFLF